MTRIAFFHTLPEERPFAEQWAVRHDVEVTFFDQELHDDTLPLLKGFNGLSYKQRTKPNADDPFGFFRRLHDLGIQQIAVRSAGLDSIDLPAAHAAGLRVTNVPSYSPPAVAELVLAQTMHLLRHIPQFDERSANGDFVVSGLMSRELSEITIGIIGVGRIGSTVARIFHALGAHVLGNDIRDRSQLSDIDEFVTKEELISRSDVVTLHTWLDGSTFHLINAERLAQFKSSAFLINASRGPVVDTDALISSLEHGRLAGAALDVVEGEGTIFNYRFEGPIPDERYRKLQSLPNVILTPHIAFFTDHAVKNMTQQSLDDALAIITGGTTPHEVHY